MHGTFSQTLHSTQFNTYQSHLYHQNEAMPQFLAYTCDFILATKFGTAGPKQSPVKWGIKEVKVMKHEADHSAFPDADVQNVQTFTYTSPHRSPWYDAEAQQQL